jgi:hypothetical protein
MFATIETFHQTMYVPLAVLSTNHCVCDNAGDVSNWVQPSETYDESCGYAVGGASTSNMPYNYVFYDTEANDSVTYHNVDGSVSSPYATGDVCKWIARTV